MLTPEDAAPARKRKPRSSCYMPHGHAKDGHRTPEYMTWENMKQRCLNPKNRHYSNYGGRGIAVCERWLEFEAFLADMGQKPAPRSTIERIDNNGNYELANCRWASHREQSVNRRSCRFVTCFGQTLTVSQWVAQTGIKHQTICSRLGAGWPPDRALTP